MTEIERSRGTRPARFSMTTFGVGIAVGIAAVLVVNIILAAIIGLAKVAIIGALVLAAAWFVLVGPRDKRR